MVTRRATQDSGGRKPEVLVKLVIGECNSRDRERKPRSLTMKVPEDWMRKLLEYARPKGRARVRKKGRGCVERRKAARREARHNVVSQSDPTRHSK